MKNNDMYLIENMNEFTGKKRIFPNNKYPFQEKDCLVIEKDVKYQVRRITNSGSIVVYCDDNLMRCNNYLIKSFCILRKPTMVRELIGKNVTNKPIVLYDFDSRKTITSDMNFSENRRMFCELRAMGPIEQFEFYWKIPVSFEKTGSRAYDENMYMMIFRYKDIKVHRDDVIMYCSPESLSYIVFHCGRAGMELVSSIMISNSRKKDIEEENRI